MSGKAMIIDVNDKLTMKNIMKRRRQKVVELIRMVQRASNTPGIIATLLREKRKSNGTLSKMNFNPS